jgi:hypothetical protein
MRVCQRAEDYWYVLSHAVNGRDIGFGRAFSHGLAKREAATRALNFLDSMPIETLLQ